MQLQNATASLDAPLQYPATVVVGPQFPKTKRDLLRLTCMMCSFTSLVLFLISPTAANAQAVSQALGLPQPPANTSVAMRQQQIIDYLGCAMKAN